MNTWKRVHKKGAHHPPAKWRNESRPTKKNMVRLIYPGVTFKVSSAEPLYPETGLYRTASTYAYGSSLECSPAQGDIYVMCQDGSIQSVFTPDRPIGWELLEDDNNNFFYRVTQFGFEPKSCLVFFNGKMENVPEGRGTIGSRIVCCQRTNSRDAVIDEQGSDGEPEVSSV